MICIGFWLMSFRLDCNLSMLGLFCGKSNTGFFELVCSFFLGRALCWCIAVALWFFFLRRLFVVSESGFNLFWLFFVGSMWM